MANKIQFQRGTKALLAAHGPLDAGEPGYTTDTKELFIGNGTGANTPLVSATAADITFYVRTDGNDANTGLANTAAGAFKTIGKAISMIPTVVDHAAVVNVAAGTYNEMINVSGFSGVGVITIKGASAAGSTHIITDQVAVMRNSCRVEVIGFKSTTTTKNNFYTTGCVEVLFHHCMTEASSTFPGFYAENGSVYVASAIVNSKQEYAFYTHVNGLMLVHNCSGSGNAVGYRAAYGGKISMYDSNVGATTQISVFAGGIVTDNNNFGVINPWGDNNTRTRTGVFGVKTSQQTISPNTWTRILFSGENYDFLNEFDISQSIITVKQTGVYLLTARLYVNDGAAGNVIVMRVKQGSVYYTLTSDMIASNGHHYCQASFPILADAGNDISIEVSSTASVTINPAADATGLNLFRIS
ncbi:hyaluronate lyase N-terminal domain-containing protein [Paenibacillus sp. FSL R7-0333]|uniref:hyaluronate lyase N-terminal domain-containing protein n=1 Tax=Paenibacillus sp. FSL R7-0333 TaxID=1926587 RepID=UPI00096D3E88|nr:hypothetical protein BK146_16690 [Paenibacillus sp. FSL R7-0333]